MTVHLTESRPAATAFPGVTASPRAWARPVGRVVLEIVKFAVVGGSGVLVNFVVFNFLLHGLHQRAMAATLWASCVAMGTNYLGFSRFAYRDRAPGGGQRIVLFLLFSGLGVAAESGLFYAGYHGWGLHGPLASNGLKAVSIVSASALRFLLYRTWVFPHDARRAT